MVEDGGLAEYHEQNLPKIPWTWICGETRVHMPFGKTNDDDEMSENKRKPVTK